MLLDAAGRRAPTSPPSRQARARRVRSAPLGGHVPQLFERHPAAMFVFDPESRRFVAVNEAAVSTYGYTRDGVPRR